VGNNAVAAMSDFTSRRLLFCEIGAAHEAVSPVVTNSALCDVSSIATDTGVVRGISGAFVIALFTLKLASDLSVREFRSPWRILVGIFSAADVVALTFDANTEGMAKAGLSGN
jgi:hypothetical protein